MNRGLVFLIVCVAAGGLFVLVASQVRKSLPPPGTPSGSGASAESKAPDDAGPDDVGLTGDPIKDDKHAAKALKDPDHAEAREWCKPEHANHGGFKISKAQMAKMTDELYTLGAKEVDLLTLKQAGLVGEQVKNVKVIKSGELKLAVKLTGIGATAGAKAAIEAAGGSLA